MSGYKVAVVGATGAVGTEIVKILEERNFPVRDITLLASQRSRGSGIEYRGACISVRTLDLEALRGAEICFFCAGSKVSQELVPRVVRTGCTVIDNTSCFRLDDDVPLIVPEVNADQMTAHKGIIANPSGATIQMVLVLHPIHQVARIRRVIVSTYQAVSATGQPAIQELSDQVKDLFNFHEPQARVYPHQIAFNCIPQIDTFLDNGYSREEMQIAQETKRILRDDLIRVCATCVRVPVFFGHSEAVNIETARKMTADEARAILEAAPGVVVEDDPMHNTYPQAISSVGRDESCVGRIRADSSVTNGLAMWIACDNLRKGAALNAVQIAERLISS